MKTFLTPLTALAVLSAGYSLNWFKSDEPRKPTHRLDAQEIVRSEAALRHKNFQPLHWRGLVLRQH